MNHSVIYEILFRFVSDISVFGSVRVTTIGTKYIISDKNLVFNLILVWFQIFGYFQIIWDKNSFFGFSDNR